MEWNLAALPLYFAVIVASVQQPSPSSWGRVTMEAHYACVQRMWERPGHCLRDLHLNNKEETA